MTVDAYDWELQPDRFKTHVLAAVYVCGASEQGKPEINCCLLEKEDGSLSLPCAPLCHKDHASVVAIKLFTKYIGLDNRAYDIVPYGFFDPIIPQLNDEDMPNREICLGYKTRVIPGTPLHPDLRIMTHEELELARPRLKRGHYAAYRAGIS